MTPDDADTAYHHLVERRTPEFDREAMAPRDGNDGECCRLPSWAFGAMAKAALVVCGVVLVIWRMAQ